MACASEPQEPSNQAVLEALLADSQLAARVDVRTGPANQFDALVRAYDSNFDHSLTREELAGRDFERFDRNADGRVTLVDFPDESGELQPRIARALDRELAWRTVVDVLGHDWKPRFRELDVDADQRLSRAEFQAAGTPPATGRRDAFAALLASVDSWDDDQLDWVELETFLPDA